MLSLAVGNIRLMALQYPGVELIDVYALSPVDSHGVANGSDNSHEHYKRRGYRS